MHWSEPEINPSKVKFKFITFIIISPGIDKGQMIKILNKKYFNLKINLIGFNFTKQQTNNKKKSTNPLL